MITTILFLTFIALTSGKQMTGKSSDFPFSFSIGDSFIQLSIDVEEQQFTECSFTVTTDEQTCGNLKKYVSMKK